MKSFKKITALTVCAALLISTTGTLAAKAIAPPSLSTSAPTLKKLPDPSKLKLDPSQDPIVNDGGTRGANSFNTQLTDSVSAPGYTGIPVTLQPSECLHVQVDFFYAPGVDLDLGIYEYNPTTGAIGNLVTSCAYPSAVDGVTGIAPCTLSEAAGVKNTTLNPKSYAILVFASQGASVYTMSVTIEECLDPYEIDDNAYNAVSVNAPITVTGRDFCGTYDNDWFVLTLPNGATEVGGTLTNGNGYRVEYYEYTQGTGFQKKTPKANGKYAVDNSKLNFFRLAPNTNFVVPTGQYTFAISVTVSLTPQTHTYVPGNAFVNEWYSPQPAQGECKAFYTLGGISPDPNHYITNVTITGGSGSGCPCAMVNYLYLVQSPTGGGVNTYSRVHFFGAFNPYSGALNLTPFNGSLSLSSYYAIELRTTTQAYGNCMLGQSGMPHNSRPVNITISVTVQ